MNWDSEPDGNCSCVYHYELLSIMMWSHLVHGRDPSAIAAGEAGVVFVTGYEHSLTVPKNGAWGMPFGSRWSMVLQVDLADADWIREPHPNSRLIVVATNVLSSSAYDSRFESPLGFSVSAVVQPFHTHCWWLRNPAPVGRW
jgi:hypothetical protein